MGLHKYTIREDKAIATIDRTEMLADVIRYLPSANALSDTILNNIINNVIDVQIPDGETVPIDDEKFYSEDLCKSLKTAALTNKAFSRVDTATIRKEKVGDVEKEQFMGAARFAWDDYVKSLSDICPFLPKGGYLLSVPIGATISPSELFVIDDCPCPTTTSSTKTSIFNPCSTDKDGLYF